MRISILGRRWQLRRVPNLGDKYADCDGHFTRGKVVRIESRYRGQELLDSLIHESFHCCGFDLFTEEYIDRMATLVAKKAHDYHEREDVDEPLLAAFICLAFFDPKFQPEWLERVSAEISRVAFTEPLRTLIWGDA